MASNSLLITKHRSFLKRMLETIPSAYEQLDTSRLTLLFFALSGLDVLGCLDEVVSGLREEIIQWIYSLQIKSGQGIPSKCCGFRGSFSSAAPNTIDKRCHHPYDTGHLAMTYTGLACLLILGDDLSKVDRTAMLAGVAACQLDDGSFCAHPGGSENDMRFVYCAIAICYMLHDFTTIDTPRTLDFIERSWNYDGGFGQGPGLESHGGSTYCAVASLHLLNRLPNASRREKLLRWCVWKQSDGFHGRPMKPDDSCYTFWLGATLKLLNAIPYIDGDRIMAFTYKTQDEFIGGFGKYPDVVPDALHTYMSLAGLSVFGHPELLPVNPALNITDRTYVHWNSLAGSKCRIRSIDEFHDDQ